MLNNIYLSLVILASLQFLDYYLTLVGFKLYKSGYNKHVEIESYELNPRFRKSISKGQYSWHHLFFVIVGLLVLWGSHYLGNLEVYGFSMSTFYMLQGMLFSAFVYINTKHIQNILLFRLVRDNPYLLSGKLKQKLLFSLKAGQYGAISTAMLLFFVFIFVPSYFTFGVFLGPLVILFGQWKWQK